METLVLLIGLAPSAVDFSKWPHLTPQALEQGAERVTAHLRNAGYSVQLLLIDDVATAFKTTSDVLRNHQPDVVSIGAGVRTDPDHSALFQQIVNLVTEQLPKAKFALNSNPHDTIESVQRAIESEG